MLNNKNFKEILAKSNKALVYISGEGCANCVSMMPLVYKIKETRKDIDVYVVEVSEENYAINEAYGVEVVPSVLLLHHGTLIAKVKGYQPEEIFELYVEAKFDEVKED